MNTKPAQPGPSACLTSPTCLTPENSLSPGVMQNSLQITLGTRLINAGVPQHMIQRLLTHASPRMTAVYAHLHDTTLRAEFERYCLTRVDIEGRRLGFDPTAVTADAEWVKHRLARAAETLPNGYFGRPPTTGLPAP